MKTIVKRSQIHGKGLFAAKPVFEGETVGRCRARQLTTGEPDGSYTLHLDDEENAESTRVNIQCKHRFINHSDEPNVAYCEDLSVVALEYIPRGAELTHDYAGD